MPHPVSCPHCKKSMQAPDQLLGKSVKCPSCKKVFKVEPAAAKVPVGAGVGSGPAVSTPSPSSPPAAAPTSAPSATAAESKSTASVEIKPTALPALTECPACKEKWTPGAISCMDCGYMLQVEGPSEEAGPPVMCSNQACGVANPPGERNCQRCGQPLPTPPGTMLHGRYRIERQLAVGGFGAVYLALDTKNNNNQVAIKDMICSDPQEFAIRLNFFHREAEILRLLEVVPIVPRVFDFIRQDQTAHLVLEFIRGQDLLKLMESRNNKPYRLEEVIEWGKSICDVLAHMHDQKPALIHRDLKPDNIMLLEDMRTIKMIDFGTARDVGRTKKEVQAAKTRVYTEGYAPPEQIIGRPEARSDLFALAGTLYHLITGEAPEGFSTAKKIESELADPNGPIPKDQRWFYELIRINLAEDKNERYFSAQEIKADLERRQVTREVACTDCKTVNKVREPYCVKCGKVLFGPQLPCTHCGKDNHMGNRFCIHCGNRLR